MPTPKTHIDMGGGFALCGAAGAYGAKPKRVVDDPKAADCKRCLKMYEAEG